MSVEIEVGLENAARAPKVTEELRLEEAPKGLANPKTKRLVLGAGAVLLVALASLFFYYHNRETTDDAQVDGHITPMASKVYGRVEQVLVDDNEQVKAGQLLMVRLAENQLELKPPLTRLADAVENWVGHEDVLRSHLRNIEAYVARLSEDVVQGREQSVQDLRGDIRIVARTIAALSDDTRR